MNTKPAKLSAARFLESHFRGKACDHEAVSECLRCNALFLANETLKQQASDEAHGWRDIESAPRDGTHFLGYCADDWHERHNYECVFEIWWHEVLGWGNGRIRMLKPTHWMPKPTDPNEQAQAIAGDGEGGANPALDRNPSNPNRLAR